MLVQLVLVVGSTALLVGVFDVATRVFFVGLLVPVHWAVAAAIAAYVRAAATLPLSADRREVLLGAAELLRTHPGRALLAVPVTLLTAPVYVLPPLTIACGMSVPAWVVTQVWQARLTVPKPATELARAA